MTSPPNNSLFGELDSLLSKTIAIALQVAVDPGWDTPFAHSPAGIELVAEEASRPAPQTGSWPWHLGPLIASCAMQVALEEAKAFKAALDKDGTSCAADVLSRGVLETSSLAWWLLDPDIDGPGRLARSLAYRLRSAHQTQKAIRALELEPEENPAGYGELPDDVQRDIDSAGLAEMRQTMPNYTDRTASLVAKIWPQRYLPYAVLSAVAHGELLGLQRNLPHDPSGTPRLRVTPNPETTSVWLWQDTYLVIGALVFTAERAATFLGLHDQLAAVEAWMVEAQSRLSAVRPSS